MKIKEKMQKAFLTPKDEEQNFLFLEGNFLLDCDENNNIRLNKEAVNLKEGSSIIITPYAKGVYSDKFFTEIIKSGIYLYKFDLYGNPVWELGKKTATKAQLIEAQILLNEPEFKEVKQHLIIELLNSKLQSETQPIPKSYPSFKKPIADWIEEVMGIEGTAARNYFDNYQKSLQIKFKRYTEKEIGSKKSNRNATDYINVLLNLGYGIMAHKILQECYKFGLEATIGFYHTYDPHDNRQSLVWDVIEPYRAIVDEVVKQIFESDYLDEDMFVWEILHQKRFLMVKEEPHAFGHLSQSAYKDMIKIFLGKKDANLKINVKIPDTYPFLTKYRDVLRNDILKKGRKIKEDTLDDITKKINPKILTAFKKNLPVPQIKEEIKEEQKVEEPTIEQKSHKAIAKEMLPEIKTKLRKIK